MKTTRFSREGIQARGEAGRQRRGGPSGASCDVAWGLRWADMLGIARSSDTFVFLASASRDCWTPCDTGRE